MHPYNQSEILMLMYYKDLTNVNMNNSGKFSFRVPKKLNLFPGMYVCSYICMYVCMGRHIFMVLKNKEKV